MYRGKRDGERERVCVCVSGREKRREDKKNECIELDSTSVSQLLSSIAFDGSNIRYRGKSYRSRVVSNRPVCLELSCILPTFLGI